MIELIALPPFIYLTWRDYKIMKAKNGVALAFELLAFIAAAVRFDLKTAIFIWAFAKTLAYVMARFGVIRAVDMLIFTGYALLVANFVWILLAVGVISVFAYLYLGRKNMFAPLTPALFALFIIYYIGSLVVG